MGQQRTDSYEQRAAKQRAALRKQCPSCGRKSAVSRTYDPEQDGMIVVCRWVANGLCDYYHDPSTPWNDEDDGDD